MDFEYTEQELCEDDFESHELYLQYLQPDDVPSAEETKFFNEWRGAYKRYELATLSTGTGLAITAIVAAAATSDKSDPYKYFKEQTVQQMNNYQRDLNVGLTEVRVVRNNQDIKMPVQKLYSEQADKLQWFKAQPRSLDNTSTYVAEGLLFCGAMSLIICHRKLSEFCANKHMAIDDYFNKPKAVANKLGK